VLAMLECACKDNRGLIPRRKDLVAEVTAADPEVGIRVAEFYQTCELTERARLATAIADRTIGLRGFFEWDSGAGPAPN
jgi:hypothetical protein